MVNLPLKNGEVELIPTKIVAVGRNYRAHAEEMQSAVPKEPVLFLKPPSAIIGPDSDILLPPQTRRVEHEVELAVIIGKRAKNVSEEEAMKHVFGYTILLDLTARDLQAEAKKRGLPWSVSKGFDTFAPVGPRIVPADELAPESVSISLKVNGELRQRGNTRDMIFTVPFLISYISRIMTLEPGDIIATGTPAGVGEIKDGDVIEAKIEKIGVLREKVRRI
ncbi:MAG: fumarylacetoacetate hydrolase family protein [Euryarchaeota archaeon]|nr:fumarylacetoacetate hydrolase family protein [Euryarchaeota archaeon]